MPATCEALNALAAAFAYPSPSLPAALARGAGALAEGAGVLGGRAAAEHYRAFVEAAGRLPLSRWEELYTKTFDLDPLVAPYIGYHIWGESYRRGPFLGNMSRALAEAGVDTMGELPDHIAPVLRYLAVTPAPDAELLQMLVPAVERMASTLRKAAPGNPYVHLLGAVQVMFAALVKDAARRAEEASAPKEAA